MSKHHRHSPQNINIHIYFVIIIGKYFELGLQIAREIELTVFRIILFAIGDVCNLAKF